MGKGHRPKNWIADGLYHRQSPSCPLLMEQETKEGGPIRPALSSLLTPQEKFLHFDPKPEPQSGH